MILQGIPVTERTTATDFNSLLTCAHDLADLSGPEILKHFRRPIAIANKDRRGGFDPVTKADQGAERVIVKALKARYPDHGVIGEEHGTHAGAGRFDWVLDPIDGTRAFIMGSPLWGTLIGLLDQKQPILGIMDQPFTGERFWSGPKASYMRRGANGAAKRLKVRECARLADATLTSTHPDLFDGPRQQHALTDLKGAVQMTRYGGDCYGYCLLAAGFVDLIVESGLKSYDIVALIPIVEKAGGVVTTWDGKHATAGGNIIAAGDKRVHEQALKLIAKSKGK
jgi:histidinol phosphatase-like enzyme (inositol monophosphatase family)